MSTDAHDMRHAKAYNALETLCEAFERQGFAKKKAYAVEYSRLLDAQELIFGSPYAFDGKRDAEQGKNILKSVKSVFDDVANKEKALSETAPLFRKKHAETSSQFSQFSTLVCTALKNL